MASNSSAIAAAMLLVLLCFFNLASLLPSASAGFSPPAPAPSTAAEQGELQNWSLVSTIVPAPPSTISGFAFAKPRTVAEVQAVVGDTSGKYPSPVLSVGSGHSSGNVVSLVDSSNSFKGTILQMTEMKGISLEEVDLAAAAGGAGSGGTTPGKRRSSSLRRRRLEGAAAAPAATETAAPAKKYYVRAGGGVILADLHDWLAQRQLEISFCPEIGDATVGSSASATMKDSSVRGSEVGEERPGVTYPPYPSSSVFKGIGEGHLAPLVRGMRYVNASGALVDLDARRSPAEAARVRALGGSFGLMGPVVDVLLETRPLALVDTRLKIVPQEAEESNEAFTEKILALRNECDNMLVSFFFFWGGGGLLFFLFFSELPVFEARLISLRLICLRSMRDKPRKKTNQNRPWFPSAASRRQARPLRSTRPSRGPGPMSSSARGAGARTRRRSRSTTSLRSTG